MLKLVDTSEYDTSEHNVGNTKLSDKLTLREREEQAVLSVEVAYTVVHKFDIYNNLNMHTENTGFPLIVNIHPIPHLSLLQISVERGDQEKGHINRVISSCLLSERQTIKYDLSIS